MHYVTIPISKALCGTTLDIETLDKRIVTVPVNEIVTPGKTIKVDGEGMPKRSQPGHKGDLIIEFDLLFPPALSDVQRRLLRAAFLLPPKLSEDHEKAVKSFINSAYGIGTKKVPVKDKEGNVKEGAFREVPALGWCGGVEGGSS